MATTVVAGSTIAPNLVLAAETATSDDAKTKQRSQKIKYLEEIAPLIQLETAFKAVLTRRFRQRKQQNQLFLLKSSLLQHLRKRQRHRKLSRKIQRSLRRQLLLHLR
ncbi:UTP--glucose-1-phosphate uridylyltransferase [Enterococcus gallinarum]|nr:UTP--glucose-1-phosphate uridylyltransferase [Enterococcus gallinarum]MCW3744447.1 UTP--glucose-1-phosphate uridylyltransferase [Enterococcus gallinarum]